MLKVSLVDKKNHNIEIRTTNVKKDGKGRINIAKIIQGIQNLQ